MCDEKRERFCDPTTAMEDQNLDSQFESTADQLEQQLEITEEGKKQTAFVMLSFLRSYLKKPQTQDRTEWLTQAFQKYPDLWKTDTEAREEAQTIVRTIDLYKKKRAELADWKVSGKSRDSWMSRCIEQTAEISGSMSAGEYAGRIEAALETANRANLEQIYTQSGKINMQRNLDGFLAEQHHVNSFNLDAATKNKPYRAEVLLPGKGESYGKNSVDIVIKDTISGKIVRRYQAKYGADPDKTSKLFEHGDYRGQRRLVPRGQTGEVERSTDIIEIDGCKSKPLSKSDAKRWQSSAQENERVRSKRYRWDNIDKVQAAKAIGKQTMVAGLSTIAFQGIRIAGRRVWNTLTGKKNQSLDKDLQEFVETSIMSGVSAGLTTAVTGGLTIAAKHGFLGATIKGWAKGNIIASSVCIAIDNFKTLYRYGKGELCKEEVFDAAGDSVATFVSGGKGYGVGSGIGASIGSVLGPVGTVVGGVVGGFVGACVGSRVGHCVYEGVKKMAKGFWNGLKAFGNGIKTLFTGNNTVKQ